MKQLLTVLLPISLIWLVTGCIEEKNEYYVNPDGSGKVVRDVFSVEAANLNFGGGDAIESDPDQQLRDMAQEALQNSKGIETWADVSTEVTDEGKLHFKGTAYFKDITKVSFGQENLDAGSNLVISRNADGVLTLKMETDEDQETSTPPTDLTDEKLQQMVKQQRLKYNQSRPLMESILANLKQTTIVHFKGQVKEAINFQQAPNTVSFAFEGKKVLEYMNSIITDDKKMEQLVRTGQTMDDPDLKAFFAFCGGVPQLPRAVIIPTEPLFDYKKEVETAKKGYDDMVESLNLTTAATVETTTVEYTEGMDLGDVRIGGARIIFFEDDAIGYRPFNQFQGYQLSVVGKLPAANLIINEGTLTKAVTLSGKSLLPEREFDRSLGLLEVADDGISVTFNAKMQAPSPDEKGMAEISGIISCFSSEGIKKIDLGLMELKEGAANEAEGVSIKKAGKAGWGDGYEITLNLNILKHLLKEIHLYDEDGTLIETQSSGSWSSNGYIKGKTLRMETLPEKAHIVIELYDNLKEYNIPFSLENILLMGTPLEN